MALSVEANQTEGIGFENSEVDKELILAMNLTTLLMKVEKQSADLSIVKSNMNAMFLIIMGSVIIFMQAGFGFLEAGSIRAKNTTNILIKNFADLTFGNLDLTYICLIVFLVI